MPNVSDYRVLSSRDLIWELYRNTHDGSKIRQALSERLIEQGLSHPADLFNGRTPSSPPLEIQQRNLPLTKEHFPYMDVEPVLDWMREMYPYELAMKARSEGFNCQNMKDPDQARNWMNYAMAEKSEWRNLPVGAWRFWKAFYQKLGMWKMLNEQAAL